MNLWTILLVVAGLVQLAGLAFFLAGIRRAPEGFQDHAGFHLKSESGLSLAPQQVLSMEDSGEDTLPPFGRAA